MIKIKYFVSTSFVLLLFILFAATPVVLALMQKISVEDLTKEADVIVIGDIKEVESRLSLGRTPINTYVTISVENYIKGSAGAATQINSCTTISSPGEYVLAQDIINSTSGACIKITSSSVVFDGAGHTIDGVDSFTKAIPSYGVHVNNPAETPRNVTVKNLKLTDWDSGIFYEGAAYGIITNNTAYSNDIGIYLFSSGSITLTSNIGSLNEKNGFFFYTSSYNTLINNTVSSNCRNGIYLDSSGGNTLTSNKASSNSESGIRLDSSVKNTLAGNTAGSNGENGIYLAPLSNNNTLTGNTANSNHYGIILGDSHNNIIADNNALYNSYSGIYLGASSDNTLSNNSESSTGSETDRSSGYDSLSNACSDSTYLSGKNISAEGIQITINGSRVESSFDSKIRKAPNPRYISTEDYSKTLTGGELLRTAFNDSRIEQLLEHVSKNNKVPRERLNISNANMFVYRYLGQNTTQYSDSMIENPFWVVEVQDNESNRVYEVYIQDGTSIHKGRIMTDEKSQELALHFKKYGKMEWDLYNALANMKGEDRINVIVWPVVVYPPGFDSDDYIPETTVEYFMQIKSYDFMILDPLMYSADLPKDLIRELGQRKDMENMIIGQKVGENTRVVMRIKPTIVDAEIKLLEKFILDKTADITFMKPVFFVNGLTKDTVLELNNRTDVSNIAMQHTFHESAQEENDTREGRIERNDSDTTSPEAPGFSAVIAVISLLVVTMRRRKI
jgi:parallel beta-helix repeat protein